MKIKACPNCGSRSVSTAGISDGINPKEFFKLVCKQCGWTGIPLEFDSENDYNNFYNKLHIKDIKTNDDVFYDPAEDAPVTRYFIRWFLIPGCHTSESSILYIEKASFLVGLVNQRMYDNEKSKLNYAETADGRAMAKCIPCIGASAIRCH